MQHQRRRALPAFFLFSDDLPQTTENMDTQTPRTNAEQKWTFGDNRPGMNFDCVKVEFAHELEKELAEAKRLLADSPKMLGMATDLNLDLQNKADMWRDEFQRIRAIVYDSDLHTNSEIAGICDRAITDIRSKISLIDQREKAADMIAKLNDEATATEALLRMYGWKDEESLQMFLHRTRQPADALKHSPEYMQKLLQNCEDELAKATAALKAIFDCTDPYADGAPDASDHDKLCNEVSALARPWARTHSENSDSTSKP